MKEKLQQRHWDTNRNYSLLLDFLGGQETPGLNLWLESCCELIELRVWMCMRIVTIRDNILIIFSLSLKTKLLSPLSNVIQCCCSSQQCWMNLFGHALNLYEQTISLRGYDISTRQKWYDIPTRKEAKNSMGCNNALQSFILCCVTKRTHTKHFQQIASSVGALNSKTVCYASLKRLQGFYIRKFQWLVSVKENSRLPNCY